MVCRTFFWLNVSLFVLAFPAFSQGGRLGAKRGRPGYLKGAPFSDLGAGGRGRSGRFGSRGGRGGRDFLRGAALCVFVRKGQRGGERVGGGFLLVSGVSGGLWEETGVSTLISSRQRVGACRCRDWRKRFFPTSCSFFRFALFGVRRCCRRVARRDGRRAFGGVWGLSTGLPAPHSRRLRGPEAAPALTASGGRRAEGREAWGEVEGKRVRGGGRPGRCWRAGLANLFVFARIGFSA